MSIDFEKVKKVIANTENEDLLQAALDKMNSEDELMTKEEAVIRLLIDLPKSG